MRHLLLFASFVGAAALAACVGSDLSTSSSRHSISCYSTAHGVVCVPVDQVDRLDRDIDGDGSLDHLVCGDTNDESSDSAGASDSDSLGDSDSADDDDGSDSTSESNADCGGGDSESDSASDSDSTVDSADSADDSSVSDGDGDGTPDGMDCDCIPPPTDPPPTDPPPPPPDGENPPVP